ncbi:DUF1054 domain-containing protein [Staphylococcus pseudintermedius]|uniref:YktB family protein n=1 Tax=Staphylococcus pseudintermedius TaxID=283734 RepID=UPI000CE3FAF0|nr:DUF1054 domain-containing protein [Staphylococcus pseudintermedius]EGQ0303060.1 DUF1054 domain-containing protein [Staphylococcus pseudintermedius]EGQ0372359.1 DUF1054 domain-containing protein [Staphylococcus pseudintermedius]EGQ1601823.1 DUF1054 domain-containing protein [Staphylococcus pseudintermedius]EGQ1736244.1 DUF1054 domain-containing protein [Staphylococcus pseudintermedius]EGQ1763093.1 DUF1054 domain-containing protein [Staphylococcus pseudintermedius]
MTKYIFKPKDFKVFQIEGLDARMAGLEKQIRPQLNALGDYFADYLETVTGETFYAHVAKHARRKVNPPKDTWVAFATNKRGYKMLPHFQIGLFEDHLFVMYGVMHEDPNKAEDVKVFEQKLDTLLNLPEDFQISLDHMQPTKSRIQDMSQEEIEAGITRAKNVKKGEFFVARAITPQSEHLKSDRKFIAFLEDTFEQLLKFYQ